MINKAISFLKKVFNKLKDKFWRAKSKYIHYYDHLPLDEYKILVESEHGKKVNGNIFYLIRYIAGNKKYDQYQIYLSVTGKNQQHVTEILKNHGIESVQIVETASDEYMRLLASAKYLINDTSFMPGFLKKEGQVYFNTWHGTPLKTLGRSDKSEYYRIGNIQKNFICSDYLLFPNEHTRNCIVKDYMLENICKGKAILCGYPRNEAFFDASSKKKIWTQLNFAGKKIYAYMPTYRGMVSKVNKTNNDNALLSYLFEIDERLNEDEIMFVNLHPLARSKIDFLQFKHIQMFPEVFETYEFLNVVDVLVTDYSSVFFDFACSRKKTVLFTYDKEDYLRERGMYIDINILPFPQVRTIDELIRELRTPKQYDDNDFLKKFCPWESPNVSQRLCDYIILGQETGLYIQKIPNNGKENVLIYAGNLAANGITTSLRALTNAIDLKKRNYYVTFMTEAIAANGAALTTFSESLYYFPWMGDMNLTIKERVIRKLFKKKVISASFYMFLMNHRVKQELQRKFGTAEFDMMIQYNGYDSEVILCLSTFERKKVIFAHNDMLSEIKTKKNARKDVLKYAYRKYDKVAIVSPDIVETTAVLAGGRERIYIVKNAIDYQTIRKKAEEEVTLDKETKVYPSKEQFYKVINSHEPKFLNIGRFSPEKGQDRLVRAFYRHWKSNSNEYLIIMGGYSFHGYFERIIQLIQSLGLDDNVVLLCRVSNPYPIISACDYFVLSSLYEGFGLVLVEADILKKAIVSTDIVGPRVFMQEHGGTLVESSEEGIYYGIQMLAEGKISLLDVDYEAYNQEVIKEFEKICQ